MQARILNIAMAALWPLMLSLFLLGALAPNAAYAADGSSTTVDFQPIIAMVITAFFAAITFLLRQGIGAAANYLAQKSGIEIDAATRAYLDDAMRNALSYASGKVNSALEGRTELDVKSETLAHAVSYVVEHVPDALVHFGITEDALEKLLAARLGQKPT